MAHPEGYRKMMRLVEQAEKFDRPIVYLIDTPGAYCGVGAEETGSRRSDCPLFQRLHDCKVLLSCCYRRGWQWWSLGSVGL